MKNLVLIFSFLLFVVNCYTQQFTFNELLLMTNDYKVFELNMIKKLNQPSEDYLTKSITYEILDSNGYTYYSVDKLPTNDKKYEKKYKFNDGQIYTESEINNKELDEDYEIRNKLVDEGGLINEDEINDFDYYSSKIIGLNKYNFMMLTYAQNYNREEEIASTWYTWSRINSEKIKGNIDYGEIHRPYKKLEIEYSKPSDFSTILNEITKVSKYIETKKEWGSYKSLFNYGLYLIKSHGKEDGYGGVIEVFYMKK